MYSNTGFAKKTIKEMRFGESGWVIPWECKINKEKNCYVIRPDAMISNQQTSVFSVKIKRSLGCLVIAKGYKRELDNCSLTTNAMIKHFGMMKVVFEK